MEKVKLTKAQANAYNRTRNINLYQNDEVFLDGHRDGGWVGDSTPLNDISFMDMCRIVIIGYEVAEDPITITITPDQMATIRAYIEDLPYMHDRTTGVGFVLDTLGIKKEVLLLCL